MKIGPKYKIARRLGAPIFEKTQTQKFALREGGKKTKGFSRPKSDFGLQMNEKQKARMFYGVGEKQFAKYVVTALAKKGSPTSNLLGLLERRLDNVVWRAGIISTHSGARQAVAHGHFLVNSRRTFVPSYAISESDLITIREGSKQSKLFAHLDEEKADLVVAPAWIKFDPKKKELSVKGDMGSAQTDMLFDLGRVIEYYQRT